MRSKKSNYQDDFFGFDDAEDEMYDSYSKDYEDLVDEDDEYEDFIEDEYDERDD